VSNAHGKEWISRRSPLSATPRNPFWWFWYPNNGVEASADFFARPEDRNALFGHLDLNATLWISANATCSILYGKRAKAAQLDAILPGHRSNDFIEYNVYGFFHHTVGEMKELTC
jgi:hypothetical protein